MGLSYLDILAFVKAKAPNIAFIRQIELAVISSIVSGEPAYRENTFDGKSDIVGMFAVAEAVHGKVNNTNVDQQIYQAVEIQKEFYSWVHFDRVDYTSEIDRLAVVVYAWHRPDLARKALDAQEGRSVNAYDICGSDDAKNAVIVLVDQYPGILGTTPITKMAEPVPRKNSFLNVILLLGGITITGAIVYVVAKK